jgi:hypothetical protein
VAERQGEDHANPLVSIVQQCQHNEKRQHLAAFFTVTVMFTAMAI